MSYRSNEEYEVTGAFFIEEVGKAYLIEFNGRRVYLPRSLVKYIRRDKNPMGPDSCKLKIPLWLAEEKNL